VSVRPARSVAAVHQLTTGAVRPSVRSIVRPRAREEMEWSGSARTRPYVRAHVDALVLVSTTWDYVRISTDDVHRGVSTYVRPPQRIPAGHGTRIRGPDDKLRALLGGSMVG
jgi:hypothetical protein